MPHLKQSRAMVYPATARLAFIAAGVCGLFDVATGPAIHFPITFVVPVLVAAWVGSIRASLVLSVSLVLARASFESHLWHVEQSGPAMLANAVLRALVLATVAGLAYVAGMSTRRVAVLEGILPICGQCKRIRDDQGRWQSVERYVSEHSHAIVSQCACPACSAERHGRPEG